MKLFSTVFLVASIALPSPGNATGEPAPVPGAMAGALQPFLDHGLFAGAVTVVATRDRVVDIETTGYADLAKRKPMKEDAVFWIASMSKPFVGVTFMMLVEEGKVNVDDPLEKYLPEFKSLRVIVEKDANHLLLRKPSRAVRIRDLLTHTSGFASRSAIEQPTLDVYPLAARVSSYSMMPLESDPGTVYKYSGAGINTVARIVEIVSGMPYEDFLATRIFQPLGMTDTTFRPSAAQVARLAKAYRQNSNHTGLEEVPIVALHSPLTAPDRGVLPAGGLFSTAHDLAQFCQMILRGGVTGSRRYLSEASIQAMNGKRTPDSVETWYGLGWVTNLGLDGVGLGHNGAYRTHMFIDPIRGIAGIFLIQRNGTWTTPEEKKILPVFTQMTYRQAGITIALPSVAEPEAADIPRAGR